MNQTPAIPLPEPVASALLAFVADRASGSVTLHFRAGELLTVETSRSVRETVARPATRPGATIASE